MTISTSMRAGFAGLAALTCTVPVFAADAVHTLDVVDRVAKFRTFYDEAAAAPLAPDARFALWQKDYGIAAVPPGPDGDAMARKLLDGAWAGYPELLPKLPGLQADAEAAARDAFDRINALYQTKDVAIHSRVVFYVGQFDNNAYSIPAMGDKAATVMMPVENVQLRTVLAHEIAHTIHFQLAGVQNSFGGPVGELLFVEGLAMRTAQKVVPGLPETAYTQMASDHDWLAQCYARKDAVLAGILPDLDKSGREMAMKYTFGQGNNGMQREGYCAAWIVMGKLLGSGRTFADLARVPEAQMVATIRAAMTAK
jgi:hypothetical protein